MRGRFFDPGGCGLQIEERPPARGAGHVIGLENARAGRALEEARRALEILKRAYSDEEHSDFVRAWIPLGKALTQTGEIAEGERVLRRALVVGEKKLPPKHRWIASTQGALGENLALQERYGEAHELLQTSYDNMKSSLGEKNPSTLAAAERLQKFQQARAE
ncbi:MAG: tetratricopeptide repeat protein [Chthoniobacterales bacterium]|nr:tetratricopeptide repeat protein [Chthoniobacterales bacterium]